MIGKRLQASLYLLALILIVAVNAAVLGRVYYNRSTTPESLVELTERELRPAGDYGGRREDSGLAMRLVWRAYNDKEENYSPWSSSNQPDWLDEAKLHQLGFRLPPQDGGDRRPGDQPQPLPKRVFVAVEMNSSLHGREVARLESKVAEAQRKLAVDPASKQFQNDLKEAGEWLERERVAGSRLFVIDAALDPEPLRKKYADRSRYIIARAIVRTSWGYENSRRTRIRGQIDRLGIEEVHLAKPYREKFRALVPSTDSSWSYKIPPRYKVSLAYGRNYEPWLIALNPI